MLDMYFRSGGWIMLAIFIIIFLAQHPSETLHRNKSIHDSRKCIDLEKVKVY